MRLCDSYKCKRLALGLTQAELGKIIGVSGATLSRFELGEEVSPLVFNCIKNSVDNYLQNLDRQTYIETRILESAYCLQYQTTKEKLMTLNHLTVHIGKLSMDLLRAMEE